MKDIQSLIGYSFKSKELLDKALTHTSYSHIHGGENYQRLEFLGDSIVDFLVAEELCKAYPQVDEGKLTKMRGAVVSATPLAQVVKERGYDSHIKLGFGDLSDKIRSDVFEALCAAIYLDGGIQEARKFVVKDLADLIKAAEVNCKNDYKSMLYEAYAGHDIKFKDNGKKGEEHRPVFMVELYIDGQLAASGEGENKKSAQKECAREVLEKQSFLKRI